MIPAEAVLIGILVCTNLATLLLLIASIRTNKIWQNLNDKRSPHE